MAVGETYPLLRETTGTLVLGVAEEFDDALLVGGKTVALLAKASWCRVCKERRRQALHVRIALSSTSSCTSGSLDVPSDLTGDLPDERSALGKEALPPGDPGGRSPGGDLCINR